MDTFIFIINTRSGHSGNEELERVIRAELKSINKSIPFQSFIYRSQSINETGVLIKKHLAEGHKYFVTVGGDGTVNTVAQNLVYTDGAIGIIPRGSGNGLAKHLKMPKNVKAAIGRLIKKRTILSDAIKINNEWSFNVAGIGFDGHISTLFGINGKRGMRNYLKLINEEYSSYKPCEMQIIYQDKKIARTVFQLAIANASQYGNNVIIAPDASLNDQLLNIGLVEKIPIAILPAFFLRIFSGNIYTSKYLKSFTTDRMQVNTNRPVHFHTDGDGRGIASQFEIAVVPNCLKIIY